MGRERQYDGVRAGSATSVEIDFYYNGQRCKERVKLEPTPANLKKASQHRALVLVAIENGTFDYPAWFPASKNAKKFAKCPEAVGLTVAGYLEKWLEDQKTQVKVSTWEDYRKITFNTIIPKIGDKGLAGLKWVDVKDMMKEMTCGNKRMANIQSVLRLALQEAVDDDVIEANVLADRTYSRKEEVSDEDPESEVDPFSAKEQQAILDQCVGQFRNLVQFAFWTGLRTSEYIALRWSDVDWQAGTVRVSKAVTRAASRKGKVEDTKTKSGRRLVKLLGPAIEALKAQKAHTLIKGQEVFQDPRYLERWADDQAIRTGFWVKVLRKAEVRYRRPYQTRHTYASMMLSAGEHPMWVAQQMGHSDWGMIRRVYGRFLNDASPDAGSRAESLYGNVDQKTDQSSDLSR